MAENGEEKITVWRVFLSQFTGAYKSRIVSEGNRLFTLKSLCGETEVNLLPKDAYALNSSVVWKQTERGGEAEVTEPGACAVEQLWLSQDVSYQRKHFKTPLKWTKHFKRNSDFCLYAEALLYWCKWKKRYNPIVVWMQLKGNEAIHTYIAHSDRERGTICPWKNYT